MFPPRVLFSPLLVAVVPLMSPPASAWSQDAPDTTAAADTTADTLAPADSALFFPAISDPRVTLLGDTLGPADTLRPKFAELPEIYPDSVIDPYTLDRPGAEPEWVLTGNELLGRGAQSLLDVLESETLALGQDLGGSGLAVFIGSPHGTSGGVQVVVDGVPAGGPLTVQWDLRRIPIESIARVAWYPGAQTAAWGGSATGGVLAITTRRSLAPSARSMLAFSVGSFDMEGFSGNLARPITARGDAFVAANFDATDGFLQTGDFTRNQLAVKAGWRFGARQRLELSRLSDGLSGEANRANLTGEEDTDAVLLHAFYGGGAGPVAVRAHGYRETQELNQSFEYRGAGGLIGDGERTGARAEIDLRGGPFTSWGAAAWEEAEVSSTHPAFLRGDGSSVLEPRPVDDPGAALVVNPRRTTEWGAGIGYRESDGRLAASGAVRRLDFGDAAEAGTAWRVDGVGRFARGVTIRASAGRALRPASPLGQALLASFAADGLEIHPGRAAAPEALAIWTGWRAEAAWSGSGWRLKGVAYGAKGRGAFLWLPPTAWLYFDRGDLETVRLGEIGFNTFDVVDLSASGLEAELAVPLPWDLRGHLRFRRLDLTEDVSGDAVPYVPRIQALGQLRYARRFFPSRDLLLEARLSGRYVDERSTLEGERLSDYLVGDLLVQATVINFTIFLSFKNLAGQSVLAEESFSLPGREGYFGVNWRFRN
ncbi:MAG TPA: TonB-dependent receptor plug domain-containing protein [Gemmatimonadota bacterium]|nr:TonB-dependent receptor plug domain-containing protein [Gemmatimonadota bacterium]